jgi:hypothetical protein
VWHTEKSTCKSTIGNSTVKFLTEWFPQLSGKIGELKADIPLVSSHLLKIHLHPGSVSFPGPTPSHSHVASVEDQLLQPHSPSTEEAQMIDSEWYFPGALPL